MFTEARREKILCLLLEKGSVTVNHLAALFSVSKETIRHDLNYLQSAGLACRCYGGALLNKKIIHRDITHHSGYDIQKLLDVVIQHSKKKQQVNKMNGTVCVIGSFNVDIVSAVPRFPQPGESIMAQSCQFGPGGKGANQALAAARALASVHFVGKTGKDQFQEFARRHLETSVIDSFTLYQSTTAATGNAVIYVSEENGENMIAINRGANWQLSHDEIAFVYKNIASADILLVQLEINPDATLQAIKYARDNQVAVILNPAPYTPEITALLSYVDIITPNETEASLLSHIPVKDMASAKAAAEIICSQGPGTVIITLGAKGALLKDDTGFSQIPVFPAIGVDTTGAGDAFNGALAAAIARGEKLINACYYASAFASLAVELEGAANMPEHDKVMNRMADKLQTFSDE